MHRDCVRPRPAYARTVRRHHTVSGFTLAELLVITGVGLLLLAIVIAFMQHRQSHYGHRRPPCLNNLKQIGLAMRLYSGDNNGYFPCAGSPPDVLKSYALMTNSYQTSYKTWICPQDTSVVPGSPSRSFTNKNVSYAYGGFGLTESVQPDTPIAADRSSVLTGTWGNTTSPYAGNVWTHKSDGGNVCFADGHVAFQKGFVPPMYRGKNP